MRRRKIYKHIISEDAFRHTTQKETFKILIINNVYGFDQTLFFNGFTPYLIIAPSKNLNFFVFVLVPFRPGKQSSVYKTPRMKDQIALMMMMMMMIIS